MHSALSEQLIETFCCLGNGQCTEKDPDTKIVQPATVPKCELSWDDLPTWTNFAVYALSKLFLSILTQPFLTCWAEHPEGALSSRLLDCLANEWNKDFVVTFHNKVFSNLLQDRIGQNMTAS